MKSMNYVLAAFAMIAAGFAQAESSQTAGVTTETINPSSQFKASIDIRPSVTVYSSNSKSLRAPVYKTENTLDVGAQVNPDLYVGYRQSVDTGVYNSDTKTGSFNPTLSDSFVRAKINNIWKNGDTSLSYEPRLYLPLATTLQDAGNVAAIRNYIALTQKVTDSLALSLIEIPIFHSYRQSGSGNKANPAFENRVYLIASYSATDKVSIEFPLMLNTVRNSTFDAAHLSGRLSNFLSIYPEIDYAINETLTVGVSYYSGNMLNYDQDGTLQGLNITNGLYQGTAQLVFRASL